MGKLCVSNSWNEIKQKCSKGEDVSTVTVPELQKQFINLKKRYQKKKAAVRNMLSGGEKGATKIKAELETVKLLTWLDDYMYERKSKSLVITIKHKASASISVSPDHFCSELFS